MLTVQAAIDKRLTLNGVHLLDHGNRALAGVVYGQLFPDADLAKLDPADRARDR